MDKAQASVELIVYVSIMLVIFGIAAVTASDKQKEIYDERVFAAAKNTLNAVVTEIDAAVSVGSGYSHKFSLPYTLSDVDYSIGVDNQYQTVYIEWSEKNYSLPLTTSNINGSFVKGENKISNRGGMITIERSADI